MTSTKNQALWARTPGAKLEVGPAPMPRARSGELVVRSGAVAVNPVDAIGGMFRRVTTPWLTYPAVFGSDVAGTVVDVGPDVTRFGVGDRVLGHAAGQERQRNSPAEGAFQLYVALQERLCTPVPDDLSLPQAAVLPLALSTAAAGLFEPDQLRLPLPEADAPRRDEVVLIWGGSTSVGCNAIQLACAAGYDVLTTASPPNHHLVRALGAEAVVDYRDDAAAHQIVELLAGRPLAGTMAIGTGSLPATLEVVRRTRGSRRLASAHPTPLTAIRRIIARRHEIDVSAIWGGRPTQTHVGPAIYRDFLPQALQRGRYQAAPHAVVTGSGLASIPATLQQLRNGVSARKLVVTLDDTSVTR